MAIKSSGSSLAFSEIEAEFGQNGLRSLGRYRANSIHFTNKTAGDLGRITSPEGYLPLDVGVPKEGEIAFSDFYSKKLNIVVDCHSGSTENQINAKTDKWNNNSVMVVGGYRSKKESGSRIIIHVNKGFGSSLNATTGSYTTIFNGFSVSPVNRVRQTGFSGGNYNTIYGPAYSVFPVNRVRLQSGTYTFTYNTSVVGTSASSTLEVSGGATRYSIGSLVTDTGLAQIYEIKVEELTGGGGGTYQYTYNNSVVATTGATQTTVSNRRYTVGTLVSNTVNSRTYEIKVEETSGSSGSQNANNCALKTGTWSSISSMVVDIGSSGKVEGAGGNGGRGGDHHGQSGESGLPGMSALGIQHNGTTVNVSSGGILRCGYGGGGGGASCKDEDPGFDRTAGGGGGGGGAGSPGGSGGAGGTEGSSWGNSSHAGGSAGGSGQLPAGGEQSGAGGNGGNNNNEAIGGTGGRGGDEENAPSAGGASNKGNGGAGAGANGAAIRRVSGYSVTINNSGSITGSTSATGVA